MAAPWFDDLTLQLDEDCDDEEQLSGNFWKVRVQREGENAEKVKSKLLIISLGDSPYLFTSKFLRPSSGQWEQVARIQLYKDADDYAAWEKAAVKRTEAVLWTSPSSNGGVSVVECRHEVQPEIANQWCEAVLQHVDAESVLMLSTYPAAWFRGVESIMDVLPMLRCLTSDAWSQKLPWPVLEPPNMLLGCPAAMLIQCQLSCLPIAICTLVIGQADVDMDLLAQWLLVLESDVCRSYFRDMLSAPRADILTKLRHIVPPPSSSGSMFQ